MKRIFSAVAGVVFCFVFWGYAQAATPIKLSLVPPVEVPLDKVVHGLDFGILGNSSKEVQGLQLSWIYSATEDKMVGVQSSLVDKAGDVTGLQWGFVNIADNVVGLQLGFVNVTKNMRGLQIGLANYIKNSQLPFMVIANGRF